MELPQPGDRIRLIHMGEDPCPIEPGTTGTVRRVHELGFTDSTQISVDWDAPRSLALIVPPDEFQIIERGIADGPEGHSA